MPKQDENITKSYFDEKFNSIMEKLDWIMGQYKGHDEEHTLISGKQSEHSDRLETIEQKLGIHN